MKELLHMPSTNTANAHDQMSVRDSSLERVSDSGIACFSWFYIHYESDSSWLENQGCCIFTHVRWKLFVYARTGFKCTRCCTSGVVEEKQSRIYALTNYQLGGRYHYFDRRWRLLFIRNDIAVDTAVDIFNSSM